jgi:hypothetical protein
MMTLTQPLRSRGSVASLLASKWQLYLNSFNASSIFYLLIIINKLDPGLNFSHSPISMLVLYIDLSWISINFLALDVKQPNFNLSIDRKVKYYKCKIIWCRAMNTKSWIQLRTEFDILPFSNILNSIWI